MLLQKMKEQGHTKPLTTDMNEMSKLRSREAHKHH